jgi:hypothetical protein
MGRGICFFSGIGKEWVQGDWLDFLLYGVAEFLGLGRLMELSHGR